MGDAIRRARESRGLSRRQLSLNAGMSQSYVGKLEDGELADPSFRAVARLCLQLDLTAREIKMLVMSEANRDG